MVSIREILWCWHVFRNELLHLPRLCVSGEVRRFRKEPLIVHLHYQQAAVLAYFGLRWWFECGNRTCSSVHGARRGWSDLEHVRWEPMHRYLHSRAFGSTKVVDHLNTSVRDADPCMAILDKYVSMLNVLIRSSFQAKETGTWCTRSLG